MLKFYWSLLWLWLYDMCVLVYVYLCICVWRKYVYIDVIYEDVLSIIRGNSKTNPSLYTQGNAYQSYDNWRNRPKLYFEICSKKISRVHVRNFLVWGYNFLPGIIFQFYSFFKLEFMHEFILAFLIWIFNFYLVSKF